MNILIVKNTLVCILFVNTKKYYLSDLHSLKSSKSFKAKKRK